MLVGAYCLGRLVALSSFFQPPLSVGIDQSFKGGEFGGAEWDSEPGGYKM